MRGNEKAALLPELERICGENAGVLRCADVVGAAEDARSPLHGYFEWNDGKAAEAYRLWQARELIVSVSVVLKGARHPAQVFVSLTSDRSEAGGYRRLVDVMTDAEQREQLLADALDDLQRWEQKYRRLRALLPVFAAARRVRRSARSKTKARAA